MNKTALICPLDWGIGHATRCVPLIRLFSESGFRVILAADCRPYEFLRQEFPDLELIRFPGTRIKYSEKGVFAFKILAQLPRIFAGISKENRFLSKLVSEYKPGVVVSDNRYGAWNKQAFSILMTHQLDLQLPGGTRIFSGLINRIMKRFISRFDECWIPDVENHLGLAGRLSHPVRQVKNSFYIGNLSRFEGKLNRVDTDDPPVIDILFMLSGPEPQRSVLENIIYSQVAKTGLKAIIVRGVTEESSAFDLTENCRVYSHLGTLDMLRVIREAQFIVSRPGYSTIMDIVTLGKKAVFIPTPGQTEQEYLAKYLMNKKIFFSMEQRNFDLLYALEMSRNFPGMVIRNDYADLHERINRLSSLPE